jgi:UDP-2,3-diacylglucosamine pyrophosphatase LpxH
MSDLHLGTKRSKSNSVLSLLNNTESEYLYLVGDIIDMWRLKSKVYWPKDHNEIIRKILKKSENNTIIKYIPGNHDDAIRNYCPLDVGDIEVCEKTDHITATGKKFLIIHGDEFDNVTRYAKWVAILGDYGYELLLNLNAPLNWIRRKFGLGYWSLSANIKLKVKEAVNFISSFEEALSYECKKNGYDGVVCGHIHHPEIRNINGVHYLNDGDFVESCTVLVEEMDGTIKLIRWYDENNNNVIVELLPNGEIIKNE